jgi:hypothetical protein
LAVRQVAGVVAGAVCAAVAEEGGVGEVCADLLGGAPEIVGGLGLVGEDVACRNEDGIGVDALASVGQPEGVVEGECRFVVCKAILLPY